MTAYIIRRLLHGVLIVFIVIVSVLVFLIMRMLPGDPVLLYLTDSEVDSFTPEQVELVRHKFGLDKSLPMQYINWIFDVVRGDLGTSMVSDTPVIEDIVRCLPRTLHIGLTAWILSVILGIAAGVISGVRRGTWWDTILTILANLGITIPIFWMGILLIYLFGYYLDWLPLHGYTSPFKDFWLSLKQSIMPIFCLSIIPEPHGPRG
ncbi:MAG: ABC transporter permease [Deltaproteobacteria bacterium]|nr:ABC transporter permease [Deltaproteobacteria bacterium]